MQISQTKSSDMLKKLKEITHSGHGEKAEWDNCVSHNFNTNTTQSTYTQQYLRYKSVR